ncbi:MAG: Rne/Rng family ribonuclease [Clostridia bacterium]|nr:Rne/Rng family ribonuclease [Clostridia bacterium]
MKELIIGQNKDTDKKYILFVDNNEILEKYDYFLDNSIEGNIYVGKVQNVLPGLQSAFINIGEKKNAFIHARDIAPKVNILEEEQVINKINKEVRPGMPILVQVKKDVTLNKGPRVTTHLNIPSRFLALMPNTNIITVSSKIEDEKEKERLIKIVRNALPENMGAIIRTVAEGKDASIIEKDVKRVLEVWDEISNSSFEKYPAKVYERGGLIEKLLVDLVDVKLDRIVCGEEDKTRISDFLKRIGTKVPIEIDENILDKFDYKKQIKDAENRKVWLKSGAFITIDRTEALTAIDVNSGKYIGKDDEDETIRKVNKEAAEEIAKQLRLRDIGGIIIIDFIDMNLEKNRNDVIENFKKFVKKDRSKVQIEQFTTLNLMELTRKHVNSKNN